MPQHRHPLTARAKLALTCTVGAVVGLAGVFATYVSGIHGNAFRAAATGSWLLTVGFVFYATEHWGHVTHSDGWRRRQGEHD